MPRSTRAARTQGGEQLAERPSLKATQALKSMEHTSTERPRKRRRSAEAETDAEADDELSQSAVKRPRLKRKAKEHQDGMGGTAAATRAARKHKNAHATHQAEDDSGNKSNPPRRKHARLGSGSRVANRQRRQLSPLATHHSPILDGNDLFASSLSDLSESPCPVPDVRSCSAAIKQDEPKLDMPMISQPETAVTLSQLSTHPIQGVEGDLDASGEDDAPLVLSTHGSDAVPPLQANQSLEQVTSDALSYASDRNSAHAEAPESIPSDNFPGPSEYWRETDPLGSMPPAPMIRDLDVFSQSQTQSSQQPGPSMGSDLVFSSQHGSLAVSSSQPAISPPHIPFGAFAGPGGSMFATARVVPNTTRNAARGAIVFAEPAPLSSQTEYLPTFPPLGDDEVIPSSQPESHA